MNRAVQMVLKDDKIPKPFSTDVITEPMPHMPQDLHRIVAINLLAVERKGNEKGPIVSASKVSDGLSRASDGPSNGGGMASRLILSPDHIQWPDSIPQFDSISFEFRIPSFKDIIGSAAEIRGFPIIGIRRQVYITSSEWSRADKEFSGTIGIAFNSGIMERNHGGP